MEANLNFQDPIVEIVEREDSGMIQHESPSSSDPSSSGSESVNADSEPSSDSSIVCKGRCLPRVLVVDDTQFNLIAA